MLNTVTIELAQKEGIERVFAHTSRKNVGAISVLRNSPLQVIGIDNRAKQLEYLWGHQFPTWGIRFLRKRKSQIHRLRRPEVIGYDIRAKDLELSFPQVN